MARTKRQDTPAGWPSEIIYLTSSVYSPLLNDVERDFLRPSSSGASPSVAVTQHRAAPVKPRRVQAPLDHPALGQYGLYAAKHLVPGEIVLDYLGYVHSPRDVDPSSDYDLSLDRALGIGIDAARMGNEARFINDYRGVRDGPNVEFVDRLVLGERRISVHVLPVGKSGKGKKGIGKGEELLVNYGKGFWQDRARDKSLAET